MGSTRISTAKGMRSPFGSLYSHLVSGFYFLNDQMSKSKLLMMVEQKTNISKPYLIPIVFVIALLLMDYAASFLSNAIGFIYPAYMSYKAIETPEKEDDTIWLTYWVVFAFFNVIEYFTNALLYWIPFYYLLKVILLSFMFLPSTKGSLAVYRQIVKPIFSWFDNEMEHIKQRKS